MYRGNRRRPSLGGISLTIGLNQKQRVLSEHGLRCAPYECWGVPNLLLVPPTIPVCYRRTVDSTIDQARKAQFDVLPNTLDDSWQSAAKANGTWGFVVGCRLWWSP